MITIRPIRREDNSIIAELIRKVFREFGIARPGTVYTDLKTDDLYTLFKTPGSAYRIAEESGNILGGCGVFPTPELPAGYAELVKFYLSEEARGKGTGKMLMQHSFDSAIELGYTHLYLESFPELSKAISMYEQSGFQSISHSLGNSGHHACNIWMVKEL